MRYFRPGKTLDNWIVFDTETSYTQVDDTSRLLLWKLGVIAQVNRDPYQFTPYHCAEPIDLAKRLSDLALQDRVTWAFAHNLYFDIRIARLHLLLPRLGWKWERGYFAKSGFNCFIVLKNGAHRLKLVNSYNLLPAKLSEIGDLLGYPKGEVEFETVDNETLASYCERDCDVLGRGLAEYWSFVDQHQFGRPCLTIASQAYTAMQSGYLSCRVYLHDIDALVRLEHGAYHGGRVECHRLGELPGRWYGLDVNSMYPAVMREGDYPVYVLDWSGRGEVKGKGPDARFDRLCSLMHQDGLAFRLEGGDATRYGILGRVKLTLDKPVFPFYDGKRLLFPIGSFWTTLAPCELAYAWVRGWIDSIGDWVLYRLGNPFTDWVDTLWRLRQEYQGQGNAMYTKITKLYMNCLYGKFAEQRPVILSEGDCPVGLFGSESIITDDVPGTRWQMFGHEIIWGLDTETTERTHFPIAAEVTARARLRLWDLIERAGDNHWAYVDTDSIFVDEVGRDRLASRIGDGLGDLKLEWESEDVTIFGVKDYRIGDKVKIKGIRRDARPGTRPGEFKQERWRGIRSDLREGREEGIVIDQITKRLNREYLKGSVAPDGFVAPFVLER